MTESALRTRRMPSTFRACLAAKARCSTATVISTMPSANGLPPSALISSASSAIRLAIAERQRSSRCLRSAKPSCAHQRAASPARATAALTAAVSATGKRPTSAPVAGLVEIR